MIMKQLISNTTRSPVFMLFMFMCLFVLNEVHSQINIKPKFIAYAQSKVYQQKTINNDVLKTIVLKFYKNNTKTLERPAAYNGNILENSGCSSADKYSIILHGWIQSCADDWALSLIDRLSYYRGGCIICIDYSVMAASSYLYLFKHFHFIANAIVSIVLNLIQYGLDVSRAYMFGFSFGGQLASSVGRALRPNYVFHNIDTCDMAGPGFDPIFVNHSLAAEHVQCFHSSRDKGTFIHSCHRNIMLGTCGYSQPSIASQLHLGSHGLCVDIYINTFDHPFYALKSPPAKCKSLHPIARIPDGYTVGYEENFNENIIGKIYVPTSLHYPYNLSKKELKFILRDKIL